MSIRDFPDAPFVGNLGTGNQIAVVEREGVLVCRSRLGLVLVMQFMSLFFGSLCAYIPWSLARDPRQPHVPLFWMGLVVMLGLVCWLVFFRNLLGMPHFEVSEAAGAISFFRFRTRNPWKTVPAADISKFTIERQFFNYRNRQYENAVLLLLRVAGGRIALCGSTDRALMKSLGEKLARFTQRKFEEPPGSGFDVAS